MPPTHSTVRPQYEAASATAAAALTISAAAVLILLLVATLPRWQRRGIARTQSRFLQHCSRPDLSGNPDRQAEFVQHDTGYHVDTLDLLWSEYNDVLPRRDLQPHMAEAIFYLSFVYIHLYPTANQFPRVMWSPQLDTKGRGLTEHWLERWVKPTIVALAMAMQDPTRQFQCIRWDERLQFDNHTAFLPTTVTGAVDTGPVYVSQPTRSAHSRLLFQPKYHACVYKFQLIISFLGHIVGYSGLHGGVESDRTIWERTVDRFPMEDGELILADGIYHGIPGLMVKYDKNDTATGGEAHRATNDVIDLYRARVEHLMHEVCYSKTVPCMTCVL